MNVIIEVKREPDGYYTPAVYREDGTAEPAGFLRQSFASRALEAAYNYCRKCGLTVTHTRLTH